MKILLLPILLLVATLTAHAHCGGCGAGEVAAEESCCSGGDGCCSEKSSCQENTSCGKKKSSCQEKSSCDKEKSCCGECGGEKAAASADIPKPKMACCPGH